MELLANELSIEGQFHEISSFRAAFERLMVMRRTAQRFGCELHAHRVLLTVEALPGVPIQQALRHFAENERRAAMAWLTRGGPFWDDLRQHEAGDWLECREKIVTDSAVGEAAFRKLNAIECGLVSVAPSDWQISPIEVTWRRDADGLEDRNVAVENWWENAELEVWLRDAPPPVLSWADLQAVATPRFSKLIFSDDCFEPLNGLPFAKSAAQRILVLLGILDDLAGAFDATGERTAEGQRIYKDYFTGGCNAWFSDSSETEQHQFRQKLTFAHPRRSGETLFCTWHGKIRSGTLRMHYWWSGRSGEPVYVVYAGPKITKR
jgi:hypothetical protein